VTARVRGSEPQQGRYDVQIQRLLDDIRLARVGCGFSVFLRIRQASIELVSQAIGAGPRTLVEIGRMAVLPTWRTEGSSLKEEW
jgi:hypothetical protein